MGDSWLSVKSKIQIDENGQTDCLKKSHTHTHEHSNRSSEFRFSFSQ